MSTGQAELCPNSYVSEFLGPSGPSSRRVPVLRKSPCQSSGLPLLGSPSDSKQLPQPHPRAPTITDKPEDFLLWVMQFLNLSGSARAGLSSFIRLSLAPSACTAQPAAKGVGDIWPVPPPRRWTADSQTKLNPRRRRRHRVLAATRSLLRVQVCCLNWLALGCPTVPPKDACVGGTFLSAHQQQALDTLERHVAFFCSAEPLSSQALGRSCEKFNLLLELASALPELDTSDPCKADAFLTKLITDLHAGWDTYARRPRGPPRCSVPQPPHAKPSQHDKLGTCSLPSGLTCKGGAFGSHKVDTPTFFRSNPFLD